MADQFTFSWSPAGSSQELDIFAIEIRHVEGDFPSLQIDVRNPRVGLLSGSVHGTLTYRGAAIFSGRLIGIPENLQDEIVRLQFVARPNDYQEQKIRIADGLKVGSYWDPVWIQDKVDDPDTALESRPLMWHIDRVSMAVSASDIIEGEDGIVDCTADDHFYDGMTVSYGQPPLTQISMAGTVTWDQTGGGSADLTPQLIQAFQASGSPLPSPLIASLTSDGLLSSWPAAGTSIGGGWSIGLDSIVEKVDWIKPAYLALTFVKPDPFPLPADIPLNSDTIPTALTNFIPMPSVGTSWVTPTIWEFPHGFPISPANGPVLWGVVFPVTALNVSFTVDWTAKRARSETVTFTLTADVQPILTDPGKDDKSTNSLSSSAINLPIDPGGNTPLFDPRSNTYFKTARGKRSAEYLLALARAQLLARARAVIIKCSTTFDFVVSWISCRHSMRLIDPRLPGGVVIGKITGYVLTYSDTGIGAEVTLGCTVGRGGSAAAPAAGLNTYVDAGYINSASDYAAFLGAAASLPAGGVNYLGLDNFKILDDGIDLFNMNASAALIPSAAVGINTAAIITAGSTVLGNIGDVTGLVPGNLYQIIGDGIPIGANITFGSASQSTLSIPATLTGAVVVVITGPGSNGFRVANGLADQVNAASISAHQRVPISVINVPLPMTNLPDPDPVAAVKAAPTQVCVDLIAVDGGTFHMDFPLMVGPLNVPQTINLE